jgi:hypothetical protein
MIEKTRVFVAYSFEKSPPPGEDKSDVDVAEWFIKLLKSRALGYEVLTGSKAVPIRIDEKIKEDIVDSSCLIGIFTKRYHEKGTNRWLPSQFVLCEAASAIGFFYNTKKLICGFYEEGLDPKDLALITIGGLELMPFSRRRLDNDRDKFVSYLKKIPEILVTGSSKERATLFPGPPYSQAYLRKIFTVYTNGGATVQNITKMLITDASRFEKDLGGEVAHEIFHRRAGFDKLSDMIGTPIDTRKEKGFLKGICRRINTRRIDTPLRIRISEERATGGKIHVSFYDKNGNRLRLKNQDTIFYQYAWGLPAAYAKTEQELNPLPDGEVIDDNAYNHAEVVANHGMIKQLVVEMRFEKGRDPLFDKSPFYQQTSSFSDTPTWSRSTEVPRIEREEDHEIWFQSFSLEEANFQGRLRVLWRPASAKMRA